MFRIIQAVAFYFALITFIGPRPATAQNHPSVYVKTVAVKTQQISATLDAYGKITPSNDETTVLSVSHAGIITRVWVRLGQKIERGAKLIDLDTSPAARADYQQAQTAVTYARQALARQKRLKAEQLTTSDQVNAASRVLKDAEDRLTALKKLGQSKGHEVLTAPLDGVITRLDVMQGQRIQADATTVQIASEDHLKAVLGVEPADAKRIKIGDSVSLEQIFARSGSVSGQVENIHAMINPATRLVDVLVEIPEKSTELLMIGGVVKGKISLSAYQALTVPGTAVLTDSEGDYVFAVTGGISRRKNVQTGLATSDFVEIKSGLKSGEKVVVLGNYELKDGMAVRESKP